MIFVSDNSEAANIHPRSRTRQVVTIKVRIQRKEYSLKIPISSSVSELYEKTAEAAKIPRNRIKLILNGRRLDDNDAPLTELQVIFAFSPSLHALQRSRS